MQEDLVRNVEAVLVLEITTFGNLSSHCSFSVMNVLANGFGRRRCPVSQIKEQLMATAYSRDIQPRMKKSKELTHF